MDTFSKLDFFSKLDPAFTRQTFAGGTVSIVTYLVMFLFIVGDLYNYLSVDIVYKYSVDTNFDKKLHLNIDLTIATPCSNVGADVMDVTNKQTLYTYSQLEEMDTFFELTAEKQSQWRKRKYYAHEFRNDYHNMHRLVWRPSSIARPIIDPEVHVKWHHHPGETKTPDSCRFHGTITVNKVAGNFHVAAGKYLPIPFGHAHISMFGQGKVNFSHRIEHFSFGDHVPNVVNPLDTVEKVTRFENHVYQYFLKAVLTDVQSGPFHAETYQYSITERDYPVDHDAGNHGVPGIYFKYDIDPIKVSIVEQGISFGQFLLRLCSIVGGVFAISGFLNQFLSYLAERNSKILLK